jgi:SM-20-related protein
MRAELAGIAEAIDVRGAAVVPAFLDDALVTHLRHRARALDAAGEFAPAGVGRGEARAVRSDVRGDRVRWIEPADGVDEERELAEALDAVRRDVNQGLSLGAFELEMHYAIYPPGAGYRRHRDRFREDDARVLSCAVYLNEAWRDADGGCLRLHLDGGVEDVAPAGGTLVAFLSDRVEHEVLAARRDRLAVAGWFRRR